MRIIAIISFVLGTMACIGQGYEVNAIPSLSGPGNQLPIVVWGDSLLVQTEDSVEFYADIAIADQTKTNLIQTAERGATWSEFQDVVPIIFPGLRGREITYAYPRPNSEELYVTMVDGKTGTYGIYKLSKAGKGYGKPVSLGLHNNNTDAIRPSFSSDGNQLYYASNASDGQGGFDVYYVNSTADGWSLPVNVKAINSASNEMEAVLMDGDLYFSSDRNGNYDLFQAEKRKQWRNPTPLPDPINSESNEMRIAFLVDGRGYFGSDRSGNLDVYEFRKYLSETSGAGYYASLEAFGRRFLIQRLKYLMNWMREWQC
ncbi:MAG: PD40 domain-containing protein [Flavobacteriales bacterium]|nr:PD40 domain-containing protein [Flavobacteriales bacterium]